MAAALGVRSACRSTEGPANRPLAGRASAPAQSASRKLLVGVGAVFLVGAGGAFFVSGRTAIADEQDQLEAAQLHLADLQTQIAMRPTADEPPPRRTGRRTGRRVAASVGGDRHRLARPSSRQSARAASRWAWSSRRSRACSSRPTSRRGDPAARAGRRSRRAAEHRRSPSLPSRRPNRPSRSARCLGKLTLIATAPSLLAIADWLDSIAADPRFADPWASGITMIAQPDGSTSVQLTMEIVLTDENLVDRAAVHGGPDEPQSQGQQRC